MNDDTKLLVEWSSPWEEFLQLPTVRHRLARPSRWQEKRRSACLLPATCCCRGCGALLLVAVIVIPAKLASMRPYQPPPIPKYDVIYYSGDELPRTEDVGGAEAGRTGRAGGREAHHRTQTIRVARGSELREKVVDAPKLNLPRSDAAVANLLAYKAIPGPAPSEGMRSSARAPTLTQSVVAPTPQVPDRLRAAPQLNVGAVPPSAAVPQRDVSTLRLPGSNAVQVVPPPVSAPEQIPI